jgi:hypothetical protein
MIVELYEGGTKKRKRNLDEHFILGCHARDHWPEAKPYDPRPWSHETRFIGSFEVASHVRLAQAIKYRI